MSERTTLARPYAVAVYKRAKESGKIGQWAEMLSFLKVVVADPVIARAVANPRVDKERFLGSFLDLCRDHLSGEGENFVRVLVKNGRLGLVGTISELFDEFRAADEGYIDVDVTTAYPLESEEETNLAALVEKWVARRGRLRVTVDRSLIAGVVLRAGDRVMDASIRGQLQRLAKRLSH